MRLTSQPMFATLTADVQMQSGKADCKVCAGTRVEIIGETTVPGRPGTGYLLVRAVEGPCSGARASLRREALTPPRQSP